MLSSLLSSTVFMIGSGSALGSMLLIFYLMLNETIPVHRTKQEIKHIFVPVITSLSIIFISTVISKTLEALA